jgi:hypothetical protein
MASVLVVVFDHACGDGKSDVSRQRRDHRGGAIGEIRIGVDIKFELVAEGNRLTDSMMILEYVTQQLDQHA